MNASNIAAFWQLLESREGDRLQEIKRVSEVNALVYKHNYQLSFDVPKIHCSKWGVNSPIQLFLCRQVGMGRRL